MKQIRVISFIDGLNLYHAIDRLRRPELKWVDLKALSKVFVKTHSEVLSDVLYFSSHAAHRTGSAQRQKSYFRALEITGVKTILGHFKKKTRKCLK